MTAGVTGPGPLLARLGWTSRSTSAPSRGSLYRYDPDGALHCQFEGIGIPDGGLAFSPEGTTVCISGARRPVGSRRSTWTRRPVRSAAAAFLPRSRNLVCRTARWDLTRKVALWVTHFDGARVTRFAPPTGRSSASSTYRSASHRLLLRRRRARHALHHLRSDRPGRGSATPLPTVRWPVRAAPRRSRLPDRFRRPVLRATEASMIYKGVFPVAPTVLDKDGALDLDGQKHCFPTHAGLPKWRRVGIRIVTSRPARLHSRCGPSDCSAAQGNLCHEAPARPVTRPNRSSATRSIDNSLIRVFRAHYRCRTLFGAEERSLGL